MGMGRRGTNVCAGSVNRNASNATGKTFWPAAWQCWLLEVRFKDSLLFLETVWIFCSPIKFHPMILASVDDSCWMIYFAGACKMLVFLVVIPCTFISCLSFVQDTPLVSITSNPWALVKIWGIHFSFGCSIVLYLASGGALNQAVGSLWHPHSSLSTATRLTQ